MDPGGERATIPYRPADFVRREVGLRTESTFHSASERSTTILLTHEEVAQMIFSDFKKRQIIEVKGSSVFILAKGKLEAMIGGA